MSFGGAKCVKILLSLISTIFAGNNLQNLGKICENLRKLMPVKHAITVNWRKLIPANILSCTLANFWKNANSQGVRVKKESKSCYFYQFTPQ